MGRASKRLTYADQVLRLVYEEGSLCPSKSGLRYKSVISFVCRPEAGPTNRPVLISLDKQTCTLFFSWHTPLACEQEVRGGRARGVSETCLGVVPGVTAGPWAPPHPRRCPVCHPLPMVPVVVGSERSGPRVHPASFSCCWALGPRGSRWLGALRRGPHGVRPLEQPECSVRNGSSVIDLSPLIHRTGGYEAYDESEEDATDTNPDFYINICQPLNPMHGVPCPAGAAVCKVPVDGVPIVSAERPGRGPSPQGLVVIELRVACPAFTGERLGQDGGRGDLGLGCSATAGGGGGTPSAGG